MNVLSKATIPIGVVSAIVTLGWMGLQIKPASFPSYAQQPPLTETIPLPDNLPAPVERFYRQIYGEQIPVIRSAVISGRATLRIQGILFPSRFRFTHETGQNYRHYIESTVFGLPLMKVNESYLNGKSRMELPFGVTEGEPKVDQGANLALWAEAVWFPSLFLTDSRTRWEPIDDTTALLVIPFGADEERIVARFDPETGMLRLFESMRYREATSLSKTLWLNEVLTWGTLNGSTVPVTSAVTWFDQGTPWAVFTVEEVVYNVDAQTYLRQKGL